MQFPPFQHKPKHRLCMIVQGIFWANLRWCKSHGHAWTYQRASVQTVGPRFLDCFCWSRDCFKKLKASQGVGSWQLCSLRLTAGYWGKICTLRQPWEHALNILDNWDLQLEAGAKMSQGSDLLRNALCRSSTNWSCFEGLAGRARNQSNRDIFVTCCQANAYGHGAVLAGMNKPDQKGNVWECVWQSRLLDTCKLLSGQKVTCCASPSYRSWKRLYKKPDQTLRALRQSPSFSEDRCTFCVRSWDWVRNLVFSLLFDRRIRGH